MTQAPYRLRVAAALAEVRRTLHPVIKRRLHVAVTRLAANPHEGKPLVGELAGYRSLRLGRYRLIYRLAPGRVIELVAFGPRKTIYEETQRLEREARSPSG